MLLEVISCRDVLLKRKGGCTIPFRLIICTWLWLERAEVLFFPSMVLLDLFSQTAHTCLSCNRVKTNILPLVSCAIVAILFSFREVLQSLQCSRSVDIVITVHNALPFVKRTIESLEKSELKVANSNRICADVFLVDSASEYTTAVYLKDKVLESHVSIKYHYLRRNSSSYTLALNGGISAGQAKTVVLLNSDILLPYRWISKLEFALYSSHTVGLVGPLSNSACYQSIPRVTPQRWSRNSLSRGLDVQDADDFLQKHVVPELPLVPLLNGFALAVRREVFEEIGMFDSTLFPEGYGEENEFCLRARKAGFSLRVADNVYIFHEKSVSFGGNRRQQLIRAASTAYSPSLKRYIQLAHEELSLELALERVRNKSISLSPN